jgi:hypothetical protein
MKYVLVYGLLAGLIVIAVMCAGFAFTGEESVTHSLWYGYLLMFALQAPFLFIGIKRYRDIERGGVIKFLPAFGLGVAIAFAAGIAYAFGFEAYLAATGYTFFDNYIATELRNLRAAGVTAAVLAQKSAEFESLRALYQQPLLRMALTFTEIFPVGFLLALVSAALLRNPKFLRSAG